MESKGIRVKKGSSQDPTFITSDPGHGKHDEACNEGKTRRSGMDHIRRRTINRILGIRDTPS
jgi:hypothetical protein